MRKPLDRCERNKVKERHERNYKWYLVYFLFSIHLRFCLGPRAFYPIAYKVGNEMEMRDPIEIKTGRPRVG